MAAISCCSTRSEPLSTRNWSGVTRPETIVSPRPQLALTVIWARSPVTGLTVNATPDTSASTICMMTTAMASYALFTPRNARYWTARGAQSER